MGVTKPHISIGLPVYNGEKYIRESIDSLLNQTYTDFELIISDNASTDNTSKICQDYASKDKRVKYYPNKHNIGAPANFNRAFTLSSGKYFKWAASDDVHAFTFLEKSLDVLESDPTIALCHSKTCYIDENSRRIINKINNINVKKTCSKDPHERFGEFLSIRKAVWPIYGLMRKSFLQGTSLHGRYIGSDRNLIAEIALKGKIYEIPECLFFGREHSQSYTVQFYDQTQNTKNTGKEKHITQLSWCQQSEWIYFPTIKNFLEYYKTVNKAKVDLSQKIFCYNLINQTFSIEGWLLLEMELEKFITSNSFCNKIFRPFKSKFHIIRNLFQ